MHLIAARRVNEATARMEAANAAIAVNPESRGVELLQAGGAARARCSRGFCR